MPGSEFFLQDSDAQLLREMLQRIEQLESATAERMQPGLIVPYLGPVRSEFWSDTHLEAVAEYWTHYYLMNEINSEGKIFDRSENEAFAGLLAADKAESLPQQGQIGGLVSEGGYSIYFPGKERSRVDLPLLSTKVNSFNVEVILKAETLPQKAVIFYNGTYGTNGYGIGIGNGAGASGEKLTVKYNAGSIWDPGITLVKGQWYDVNLNVSAGGVTTITVATINPTTKVMTVTSASASLTTFITPTARACLGSADSTTLEVAFKGWIDELNIYDGIIPSTEVVKSQHDRYRTALESAAPPGFVKPDGTAVSRAKFDRLFKVIGTIYGVGDGSTTFNLPDLRGRIPVDADGAAGRLSSKDELGESGGEEKHQLTVGELAKHTHSTPTSTVIRSIAEPGTLKTDATGTSGTSGSAGNDEAHDNMQPYLITNYLIKI